MTWHTFLQYYDNLNLKNVTHSKANKWKFWKNTLRMSNVINSISVSTSWFLTNSPNRIIKVDCVSNTAIPSLPVGRKFASYNWNLNALHKPREQISSKYKEESSTLTFKMHKRCWKIQPAEFKLTLLNKNTNHSLIVYKLY